MKNKYFKPFLILMSTLLLLTACAQIPDIPEWMSNPMMLIKKVTGDKLMCDDVQFAQNSGKPFATISLNSLPEQFGELPTIEITDKDETFNAYFPIERNGSGAQFTVPAHPEGKVEGGEVL